MHVHWDGETKSRVDLKKCGAFRYFTCPDADVLFFCYRVCPTEVPDNSTIYHWLPGNPIPDVFRDPTTHFHAWNASFERLLWKAVLQPKHRFPELPPLNRWSCSMAIAQQYGLPAKLELAGPALNLNILKDRRGHMLIQRWCVPMKDGYFRDPYVDRASFAEFVEYGRQDVASECAIMQHVPAARFLANERAVWEMDQRINERGIHVDQHLARQVIVAANGWAHKLDNEAKRLTRGLSVKQRDAILAFLREHDPEIESLARDDIEEALPRLEGPALRVAQIRLALSRSSISKFDAMLRTVMDDGRVRGMFGYHLAHTGRWAGRLVQLQNLPRTDASELVGYPQTLSNPELLQLLGYDPMTAYSGLVRAAFLAGPGRKFLIGDFSQIELVVSCWLSGQRDILDLFLQRVDIYKIKAVEFFGLASIEEVTKEQRQLAKSLVLGAGYGMGPGRFRDYLEGEVGIVITEAEARRLIYAYRNSMNQLVAFWRLLTQAMIAATEKPGTQFQLGLLIFIRHGDWLAIKLPSGRALWYKNPIVTGEGWRRNVVCDGKIKGRWMTAAVRYWGGLIMENVTQAIARDVLVEAMQRSEAAGLPVVLHAHDEEVAEVAQNVPASIMESVMSQVPTWASGLPIRVEMKEGLRYQK